MKPLSSAQLSALGRMAAKTVGEHGCERPRHVHRATIEDLIKLGLVETVRNQPTPGSRRRVPWTTYRLTQAGLAAVPPRDCRGP